MVWSQISIFIKNQKERDKKKKKNNSFLYLPAQASKDGRIELPVEFKAAEPGHYPCEIVLRGSDDVRVYRIECTVNPEGSTAELMFTAPVHQNVTQEIPIVSR